jgi:hypothetical protein
VEEIEEEVEALGIITNLTGVIKEYSSKVANSSREHMSTIKKDINSAIGHQ